MIHHRRKWLKLVDGERVQSAIKEAELLTSGEIRVSVSTFFWGDVKATAQKAFGRLHMQETRERNGVLFFVVPSRRRFVVLGDEGIHAKVGQDFWDAVVAAVSERFRIGDFTGGLVRGIGEVGTRLAQHFPRDPETDVNELPDAVDYGGPEER
jgi:uncharacterized membrane protein